jgi:GNAT superfamily N-acetyltransferase
MAEWKQIMNHVVIIIRTAVPEDHARIITVMPYWWGGRDLRTSVPRLFLNHFRDTSFIAEHEGELVGFLIGFMSQSERSEAYIHFAGVHPEFRKRGIGRRLFERFFALSRENNRTIVRSCTSPVNRDSIEFHRKMEFTVEPGDTSINDIPATLDYNRPDDPKVLFTKHL